MSFKDARAIKQSKTYYLTALINVNNTTIITFLNIARKFMKTSNDANAATDQMSIINFVKI